MTGQLMMILVVLHLFVLQVSQVLAQSRTQAVTTESNQFVKEPARSQTSSQSGASTFTVFEEKLSTTVNEKNDRNFSDITAKTEAYSLQNRGSGNQLRGDESALSVTTTFTSLPIDADPANVTELKRVKEPITHGDWSGIKTTQALSSDLSPSHEGDGLTITADDSSTHNVDFTYVPYIVPSNQSDTATTNNATRNSWEEKMRNNYPVLSFLMEEENESMGNRMSEKISTMLPNNENTIGTSTDPIYHSDSSSPQDVQRNTDSYASTRGQNTHLNSQGETTFSVESIETASAHESSSLDDVSSYKTVSSIETTSVNSDGVDEETKGRSNDKILKEDMIAAKITINDSTEFRTDVSTRLLDGTSTKNLYYDIPTTYGDMIPAHYTDKTDTKGGMTVENMSVPTDVEHRHFSIDSKSDGEVWSDGSKQSTNIIEKTDIQDPNERIEITTDAYGAVERDYYSTPTHAQEDHISSLSRTSSSTEIPLSTLKEAKNSAEENKALTSNDSNERVDTFTQDEKLLSFRNRVSGSETTNVEDLYTTYILDQKQSSEEGTKTHREADNAKNELKTTDSLSSSGDLLSSVNYYPETSEKTALQDPSSYLYLDEKPSDGLSENRSTQENGDIDLVTTDFSSYTYTLPTDDVDSTDADFTRIPKKIEGRQLEPRSRPARPDPGYNSYALQAEYARPYRPDSPSYERPYFRPTPDYRTPLIRQNPEQSKQVRPDEEYGRPSFKEEHTISRPPYPLTERVKEPSDTDFSKIYRPTFSRPYRPQSSSFSRPYRPDFHRPSSSATEFSEGSKGDFPDTHDSHGDRKYAPVIVRPTDNVRDIDKPSSSEYEGLRSYKPIKGTVPAGDQSKMSKPSSIEPLVLQTSNIDDWSKPAMFTESDENIDKFEGSPSPSKFDGGDIYRKPSIYPRPGFGSNYADKIPTTPSPFSMAGSIVSSRNLTRVEVIKADCFDNHMKVTVQFNGSFEGLVYSSGYSHDPSCNYINGSGRNHYEFFIRLNRCGTLGQQEVTQQQRALSFSRKRQERAQYLVNTVTVQYNPLIEEDIDEHFRVTCEYGYNFWKTVTFPVIGVESSEVKLRTGNPVVFTLPPPQCNMEIRSGYGPTGNRITGPVNVGDPLTLVIHMKSETPGFDILVSNCVAHNGGQKRLKLVDNNGCVVQEKLISAFRGVNSPDRLQQLTLYSYLKAFRFTGSPALYIECDVHMCHGSCPPQRCYWRHLYKRSIGNFTEDPSTDSDSSANLLSESVSLFQALEVRHEDVDAPSALSGKQKSLTDEEGIVCMRTVGFTAMFTSLLILLFLSCFVSICLCSRMRKMKHVSETQDSNYFVSFDGHTALK